MRDTGRNDQEVAPRGLDLAEHILADEGKMASLIRTTDCSNAVRSRRALAL